MKVLLEVTARGSIEVDLDEEQLEDVQVQLADGPVELDAFVSKNAIEFTDSDLYEGLHFKAVSADQVAADEDE